MEVILKKSKITKSIFNQSVFGAYSLYLGNNSYDNLGWCIVDNKKYIILYNKDKNTVVRLVYPQDSVGDIVSNNIQEGNHKEGYTYFTYFFFVVYLGNNTIRLSKSRDEETAEKTKEQFISFMEDVNQKGHFYL